MEKGCTIQLILKRRLNLEPGSLPPARICSECLLTPTRCPSDVCWEEGLFSLRQPLPVGVRGFLWISLLWLSSHSTSFTFYHSEVAPDIIPTNGTHLHVEHKCLLYGIFTMIYMGIRLMWEFGKDGE